MQDLGEIANRGEIIRERERVCDLLEFRLGPNANPVGYNNSRVFTVRFGNDYEW